MTAATNLFPQTLPDSLEFPPLYNNVVATPSMGSGLGFIAMADPAYTNTLDATTGNFDYHSSDHIFDSFNASLDFRTALISVLCLREYLVCFLMFFISFSVRVPTEVKI